MAQMQHHRVAQRAARAVYGSIIALAVIAVLEETGADALEVILAAVGGVIAAMLAEGYAEYIAAVIRERRFPSREEFVAEAKDVSAGALAALVPLVPFVFAEIGVFKLDVAYDIAPWLGAAVIGTYVFVANRLAGLRGFWNFASIGIALAVALSLVAIKALTH